MNRANGIEFDEVLVDVAKGQQRSPEYAGLLLGLRPNFISCYCFRVVFLNLLILCLLVGFIEI